MTGVPMATYQSWNTVLAHYFLQGIPCGYGIYLSVDNAVLETIAQQEFESTPLNGSWRDDLIAAVRNQVVRSDRIDLDRIQGYEDSTPLGIGFLSVCVLAAYDMANDEDISETNYFRRLRGILRFDMDSSAARPPGMQAGSEAPLWKCWNQWLLEKNYIPTAKQGTSTKTKFINYPISQCLLRQADCDRLEKHFHEQGWTSSWDSQTLFSRLRENTQQFPEYLRRLIKDSNDRYEVLAEAVQEVHQQWIEAGCPAPDQAKRSRTPSPNLFAGLYRSEEDYEIEYYLYPKQKPQQKWETVQVEYQGEIETLENDRPGWYLPIGSHLSHTDLDQGIRCNILNSKHLKTLQLPARDFWILVLDPEEPESGVYGTWRSPQLGEAFILLCKQELMKDLNLLRDKCLVNWSNEIELFQGNNWRELHNFQVLSQTWQGIFIENWELKDALQPKVRLAISLSGGLRHPNQKGWLQGHLPKLTIFGFMQNVKLEVLKLPDEKCVQPSKTVPVNKPWSLNIPDVGIYLIRVIHDSNITESFLKIVGWDTLQICDSKNLEKSLEKVNISNFYRLCGVVIY